MLGAVPSAGMIKTVTGGAGGGSGSVLVKKDVITSNILSAEMLQSC
jgi:hypothetical protein